jgi:hypothetical protein
MLSIVKVTGCAVQKIDAYQIAFVIFCKFLLLKEGKNSYSPLA